CQPFIFRCLPSPETAEKLTGLLLYRGAHSTLNRHLVNRFLKKLETHFLQHFQTVAFRIRSRLSGLPLERDAHSTELRRGVNELLKLFQRYFGFPLSARSECTQTDHKTNNTPLQQENMPGNKKPSRLTGECSKRSWPADAGQEAGTQEAELRRALRVSAMKGPDNP
uniref:hypothetical protein n=1 Tax=Marinobacter lipolyticus TaxID=209639 RepID=UPI003A94D97F